MPQSRDSDPVTLANTVFTVSAAVGVAGVTVAVAPIWRRAFVSMSLGALRGAAGLLPGRSRSRYLEEWRGELYDLRADGAWWWQRAGYIIGVLYAASALAITLRRSRARAVD